MSEIFKQILGNSKWADLVIYILKYSPIMIVTGVLLWMNYDLTTKTIEKLDTRVQAVTEEMKSLNGTLTQIIQVSRDDIREIKSRLYTVESNSSTRKIESPKHEVKRPYK